MRDTLTIAVYGIAAVVVIGLLIWLYIKAWDSAEAWFNKRWPEYHFGSVLGTILFGGSILIAIIGFLGTLILQATRP